MQCHFPCHSYPYLNLFKKEQSVSANSCMLSRLWIARLFRAFKKLHSSRIEGNSYLKPFLYYTIVFANLNGQSIRSRECIHNITLHQALDLAVHTRTKPHKRHMLSLRIEVRFIVALVTNPPNRHLVVAQLSAHSHIINNPCDYPKGNNPFEKCDTLV